MQTSGGSEEINHNRGTSAPSQPVLGEIRETVNHILVSALLLVQCHHALPLIQPGVQSISTSLTVTADVFILYL